MYGDSTLPAEIHYAFRVDQTGCEMASESSEAPFSLILWELCDGLAEISRRSLGK